MCHILRVTWVTLARSVTFVMDVRGGVIFDFFAVEWYLLCQIMRGKDKTSAKLTQMSCISSRSFLWGHCEWLTPLTSVGEWVAITRRVESWLKYLIDSERFLWGHCDRLHWLWHEWQRQDEWKVDSNVLYFFEKFPLGTLWLTLLTSVGEWVATTRQKNFYRQWKDKYQGGYKKDLTASGKNKHHLRMISKGVG